MDETCYLVLNSKQSYSITIDSLATVETFCLFVRNGLVEDVSRVTESGPTRLLDNPVPGASHASESAARADNSSSLGTSVEFFETLHAHDAVVSPLIQRIYARLKDNTASDLWLEDQFLGVAGALCKLRREADKDAELIPAKKYSSRMELYRRLLRGKDYMDSFSGAPVHLGEVAENACLFPVSLPSVISCGLSRDTQPIPATKAASKRPAAPGTRRAEHNRCLPGGWLRERYLLQRAFPAQLWVFATRIPSAEKRFAIERHRHSCLYAPAIPRANPNINERQI